MKKIPIAISTFHDGSAGQISEWLESVSDFRIACYFTSQPYQKIDPQLENTKRVSRKMEYPTRSTYRNKPLYWGPDWVKKIKKHAVKTVLPLEPENRLRWATIQVCHKNGFALASAIHPSAMIMPKTSIADGVWIHAKALIGYKTDISEGTIVNSGSIIEHHNVLKSCVQIDPGVITTGGCTVLERGHVHTGAILINRVVIGQDARVGAGSLVRKDVPSSSTVVGIPAKKLKGCKK